MMPAFYNFPQPLAIKTGRSSDPAECRPFEKIS